MFCKVLGQHMQETLVGKVCQGINQPDTRLPYSLPCKR
jgi:hypothetical protein